MAKLAFGMPNLLNFPMGKLYYDLILEVIDELDPNDVPALMKVDRRLRWILLQKPARIFGKQIDWISIYRPTGYFREDTYIIRFQKFRELPSFRINFDESTSTLDESTSTFDESTSTFDESTSTCDSIRFSLSSRDVLLLSQVERCSCLFISQTDGNGKLLPDFNEKERSALKKIFANLKQVNHLYVDELSANNFNDFFKNFKTEVTDHASFDIWGMGEVEQQLVWSLISDGGFRTCKTIQMNVWKLQVVESTIRLILNSGIPGENKEATCFVRSEYSATEGEMKFLIQLIKNFPEIRDVNEREETFIINTMKKSLESFTLPFAYDPVDEFLSFGDPCHCYWKRFDEIEKGCIYVVSKRFFFTKYVPLAQGNLI